MTEAIKYFNGDDFCATVWKSKYAQKDEKTPDDTHRRLEKEFLRIRNQKGGVGRIIGGDIFSLFKNYSAIIPQGRVQSGLGVKDSYRSLSNCLRLPPPDDSYSSIMATDTQLVNSAKRGCGYGVGLSLLRPRGATTSNASRTSTGVLTAGNRYSNSTHEVGQEGRRGACLLDLDIRHPDAPEFAVAKLDKTKLTGANISFKIWNEFLEAVENDEDYILTFPCRDYKQVMRLDSGMIPEEQMEYDKLYKGALGYYKKIRAKELWDKSIHTVWSDGCPGLQFWDKMIGYDPSSVYKEYYIDGTNACGEQPMAVYDTCRLICLNLYSIVKYPFTSNAEIDYTKLYNLAYNQMILGDDLVDLEIEYIERIIDKVKSDPESEQEKALELELWENVLDMAKNGRRVGAGITALADMIAALGLSYDSKEALDIVEEVMEIKMGAELDATINLAKGHGPFKGWDKNLEYEFDENGKPIKGKNEFYQFLLEEFPSLVIEMCKHGRRNVNWSTIAPVGTMSIVSFIDKFPNTSSGCEPVFFPYYFRNKKVESGEEFDYIDEVGIKWKQYPVIMGGFKKWLTVYLQNHELDFDSITKDKLDGYFKISPYYKSTAGDIDWEKRVEMQAILQKYTTSAISSTINLPNNVEEKVISDIYLKAWKSGLKGITCYRDGSKGGVLVSEKRSDITEFSQHDAVKRPKELISEIHTVNSKGTKFNVFVGMLDNKPYEVFATKHFTDENKMIIKKVSKGRYDLINLKGETYSEDFLSQLSDEEAAVTRLISTSLRHGVDIKYIVEQLNKTNGSLLSFDKAIARILKKYIPDGTKSTIICNECGSDNVQFQEGCLKCVSCGNAKCG